MIINRVFGGQNGANPNEPFLELEVEPGGTLIHNTTTNRIIDICGSEHLFDHVLYKAYQYNNSISGLVDLGSLKDLSEDHCLSRAFERCENINEVDFLNLQEIFGDNAASYAFSGAKNLTRVNIPNLTRVLSKSGMYSMFSDCENLQDISFPNLLKVGDIGLGYSADYSLECALSNCYLLPSIKFDILDSIYGNSAFRMVCKKDTSLLSFEMLNLISAEGNSIFEEALSDCQSLNHVNLEKLQSIIGNSSMTKMFSNCASLNNINFSQLDVINGDYALESTFSKCLSLQDVNFPVLKTIIGKNLMYKTFYGCSLLNKIRFPSLSVIDGSSVFNFSFDNCSLLGEIWFYAINDFTFGTTYTDQFKNMLSNCNNITVHFPMKLDPLNGNTTISSLTGYPNWGGGTACQNLFDIVTEITDQNSNIYYRMESQSDPNFYTAWDMNGTTYYTVAPGEPNIGNFIYTDPSCTITYNSITSIA